jgi:hypothetical protein
MTYSYVRQAWVEEQIDKGVFGITTISRAAGITEATGKTWLRQAAHRLPSHKKMPREYERALGILLLRKYPDAKESIANLVFTRPRTLNEWDTEDRLRATSSDLRVQTRAMAIFLKPVIDEYFQCEENKIILRKNIMPDSSDFEEKFFDIHDLILYLLLEVESNFRASQVMGSWSIFSKFMDPSEISEAEMERISWRDQAFHIPMYGPHKRRYVLMTDSERFPLDWGDCQKYRPGLLAGVNIGGHYNPSYTLAQRTRDFIDLYDNQTYEEEILPKIEDLFEFFERERRIPTR